MSIIESVIGFYQRAFCRRRFYRMNRLAYGLALRGLGILNFESDLLSGEREILKRMARLGGAPTILDVGAHEGSYAGAATQLIPAARVFAFEPHPDTFQRLQAGAEAGRYTPIQAALSDRVGIVRLHDYAAAGGTQHASIVGGVMEHIHQASRSRSWEVACVTIDEFVRDHGIGRIHLLKIDTEGSELQVLRGARRSLDSGAIDVIQLEFNSMNVVSRVFMRDFRQLLAGYTVYRLLRDGPVPLGAYNPAVEEIFAFQNVLFVSDRAPPDVRRILAA